MTPPQIKAELRRSAVEDQYPFSGCKSFAFHVAGSQVMPGGNLTDLIFGCKAEDVSADLRTFFLLISESL